MSFELYNALAAGEGQEYRSYAAPSTQFNRGDLLKQVNGLFTQCSSQTDKGLFTFDALETQPSLVRPATLNLTDTNGQRAITKRVAGSQCILITPISGAFAPPKLAQACGANASATTVVVASASGSAGDFVGGTICILEFGSNLDVSQRYITASTWAGGYYTFTINRAFGNPLNGLNPPTPLIATTGNTATFVPFQPGTYGIKLNATTPYQGISCVLGDQTGGFVKCEDLDLFKLNVYVTLPNLF